MEPRVGIFGGTFDPVHLAHTHLARLAIEQCKLDQMIVVPCSRPPHRSPARASDQQRVEMLSLAMEELPNSLICDYELKKESLSYTVETLEFLTAEKPGCQLVFCLGGDSLRSFTQWHRWRDILKLANLAVMAREELNSANLEPCLAELVVTSMDDVTETQGQILMLETPDFAISSTLIRQHLERDIECGRDFMRDPLLTENIAPKVLSYMIDNKVYQ